MRKNDTRPFSLWDIPLALVLLTRLPLPRLPAPVFSRQAQAVWAFPVVGLIVGVLGCAGGWIAMAVHLPSLAAATVVVAILIVATGAMHEDGLADTFDGLWGGFTPDRRLEIMKDSQIGTYGVLALVIWQGLRIAALAAILGAGVIWPIIAACVLSRALMPVLMSGLPHARSEGLSHSVGTPALIATIMSVGLAVLVVLLLGGTRIIVPGLCAAFTVAVLGMIAKRKIGGQTGDILGASQQMAEISFLLAFAAGL
ncbi:MAG: adenosylcobinamide-GDP ribazoletransferase [Pseudomonadota bacterium]